MRVCFFLGPSLSAADLDAAYMPVGVEVTVLPPVQQGDLLRLIDDLPDVIGIVDGYFFQTPAVLHKEILFAMERGARVLGAASIGALRAAELDRFGMEGVGEIYRWYRRGKIDGDDEVAVLHAPAADGFRAQSEPLVNLRYNGSRARIQGVISARLAHAFIATARRLHFSERSYERVLHMLDQSGAPEGEVDTLRQFLLREAVDLKRADARALVRTVASRIEGSEPWPSRVPVRTSQTVFFHLSRREYEGNGISGAYPPDSFVLSLYKLLSPSWPRLFQRVCLRCVAVDEALHRGIDPSNDETLVAQFCVSRGIDSLVSRDRWLARRGLALDDLADVLRQRDLEARLLAIYRADDASMAGLAAPYRRIVADVGRRTGMNERQLARLPSMPPGIPWEGPFLRELKFGCRFSAARARAGEIVRTVTEASKWAPGLAQSLAADRLEAWAANRWNVKPAEFEHALAARGFAGYREFVEAAQVAYLHERFAGGEAGASGVR